MATGVMEVTMATGVMVGYHSNRSDGRLPWYGNRSDGRLP